MAMMVLGMIMMMNVAAVRGVPIGDVNAALGTVGREFSDLETALGDVRGQLANQGNALSGLNSQLPSIRDRVIALETRPRVDPATVATLQATTTDLTARVAVAEQDEHAREMAQAACTGACVS